MDNRKVIQLLKKDGWELKRTVGSHHHFVHPTKIRVSHCPTPQERLANRHFEKHRKAGKH
jgi:predicted RNA binding protein YcfA (HicA-like mRNA interferase family)